MKKVLFILICMCLISGPSLFGGETILENGGFETGEIDPWAGRGGAAEVVPGTVTEPAPYRGSYCGRAYNRTSGWHGMEQGNLVDLMVAGETYTTGAWVRTNSATAARVNMAFQWNDGTTHWTWAGNNDAVDNSEWVFVTGSFVMPENVVSISLYFESSDATLEIFVDDAYCGIGEYTPPGGGVIRGAATDPVPSGETLVDSQVTSAVSWTGPVDPNLDSIGGYDVYFGTDPNVADNPMTSVSTESLPVALDYGLTYYWRVDTHVVWDANDIAEDGSYSQTVEGYEWEFTTLPDDLIPVVTVDDVLTSFEYMPATLTGTVTDDGTVTSVAWEVLGTTATPEAKQMITRGNDLSAVTSDPNLLMDWIGTDTRQPGNPMYLTLKGLPAGTYNWLSYHHDAENQTGVFDATVYDANGSAVVKDIAYRNGNTLPVITVPLTITSNGTDDVVLTFDLDDSDMFFVMNGFELTDGVSVDPLYIDFGTPDAKNLMTGYQLYQAEHEVEETFTEQSFSVFGTTVSILPTWGGAEVTLTDITNDPSLETQTATLSAEFVGSYVVQLSATDDADPDPQTGSATAVVTIAADACSAAQLSSSWPGFSDYDTNEDCLVDLNDFASIASEWLDDRNMTAQE